MSACAQAMEFGKPVVRCECGLKQFQSKTGRCVKCGKAYSTVSEAEAAPVAVLRSHDWAAPKSQRLGLSEFELKFCATVKLLRTALGLSQQQLAESSGWFRTYVSKVENGAVVPRLEHIAKFAELFHITLPGLFLIAENIR
jgi:DNA-binding XRE family transcriptional regulator